MNPEDCYDKVRYSLSDESGILRFKAFDIIDVPDSCEMLETLKEYLVGRPLAEVDLEWIRRLRCKESGECMRTVVRVVHEALALVPGRRL